MDDRTIQFSVGFLVVATIAIAVILVALFGDRPQFGQNQKTIVVHFPSAPGVQKNTPVRKSGITVGRVTDVELEDDGSVVVTAKIDGDRRIYTDETCRITSDNLFGDAMLEFVPNTQPPAQRKEIGMVEEFDGVVTRSPVEAMSELMKVVVNLEGTVNTTLASFRTASTEVEKAARNMNVVVEDNQDEIGNVIKKSEQALDRLDRVLQSVDEVLGDDKLRNSLHTAMEKVPVVLEDTDKFIQGLERVANEAEQNLKNLQGLTGPLGEKGAEIVAKVESSVDEIDTVLREVAQLAKTINDSRGTVWKLLNDQDLYQRLNRAAANMEHLTRELKPVVENAKVFTDKIARQPNRLGVRGALDSRASGIK